MQLMLIFLRYVVLTNLLDGHLLLFFSKLLNPLICIFRDLLTKKVRKLSGMFVFAQFTKSDLI